MRIRLHRRPPPPGSPRPLVRRSRQSGRVTSVHSRSHAADSDPPTGTFHSRLTSADRPVWPVPPGGTGPGAINARDVIVGASAIIALCDLPITQSCSYPPPWLRCASGPAGGVPCGQPIRIPSRRPSERSTASGGAYAGRRLDHRPLGRRAPRPGGFATVRDRRRRSTPGGHGHAGRRLARDGQRKVGDGRERRRRTADREPHRGRPVGEIRPQHAGRRQPSPCAPQANGRYVCADGGGSCR